MKKINILMLLCMMLSFNANSESYEQEKFLKQKVDQSAAEANAEFETAIKNWSGKAATEQKKLETETQTLLKRLEQRRMVEESNAQKRLESDNNDDIVIVKEPIRKKHIN
jgi:DNA-directed RNA polymerase beta' subunit